MYKIGFIQFLFIVILNYYISLILFFIFKDKRSFIQVDNSKSLIFFLLYLNVNSIWSQNTPTADCKCIRTPSKFINLSLWKCFLKYFYIFIVCTCLSSIEKNVNINKAICKFQQILLADELFKHWNACKQLWQTQNL